jgi:LysR family transcriptional activator of glutamate synthase operon
MNLAQLSYFRHLAKIQHYTRASEELHISQSALSHSIASLEDELGCSLFRKEGRNVYLTDDGRVFQNYVDQGLAAIEQGVAELQQRHGMLTGAIEIGAIATVRSGYLPAAMKAYTDQYGSLVEFHVAQGETGPLNQRLEQGVYDLVIAGPHHKPDIECKTLFYQQLVVAVRRDHPLASLKSIHWDNLVGHTVNTYRRGIMVGETLEAFLKATNAPVEKLTLVRNYEDEVMLGALAVHESSVALTMLTSNLLPDPNMVIIPLDIEGAETFYPISLTYQKKVMRTPAAQSFIDFLLTFKAPVYERDDFRKE